MFAEAREAARSLAFGRDAKPGRGVGNLNSRIKGCFKDALIEGYCPGEAGTG